MSSTHPRSARHPAHTKHVLHRPLRHHHRVAAWAVVIVAAGLAATIIVTAYRAVTPAWPGPRLDRVTPFLLRSAPAQQGVYRLRIFGDAFREGARVVAGSTSAAHVYVVSPTELTAEFTQESLAAGWYDLLLLNFDRQSALLTNAFAVQNENGVVPRRFFSIRSLAEGIAFAAGQAPANDATPNINVGTYSLNSLSDADAAFVADRLDFFMGNTLKSADIKASNAHPKLFPYMDLTEYNNGDYSLNRDGHTDAKIVNFVASYNAANDPDIDVEDFYLHAKCDCDMSYAAAGHCQTYNANDSKCTQTAACPYSFITGTRTQYYGWNPASPGQPNSGCLASTATSRAASRMMSAYLPSWDVPNYAHPQLDDFWVDVAKRENIGWSPAGTLDGLLFDTVVKDNTFAFADGIHMSWEYWGVNSRSTAAPTQAFYDYFALQNSVQRQLNATPGLGAMRWPGNVISVPNEYPPSIYTNDTLSNVPEFFVETFFDGNKNGYLTYQPECSTLKSILDESENKGKKFFLNAYERSGTSCADSSDCRTERGKIQSLAMYYLVARTTGDGITGYSYSADVTNGTLEQRAWNAAATVDLGEPTPGPAGAKDIFGNTNTENFYNFDNPNGGFTCPVTSTTPTTVVYARNFSGGLVLVKHRYDWADSTVYGDESASDTTKQEYTLDGYYHPVRADGTLGAAVNAVNLSNSEGAILLRDRAAAVTAIGNKTTGENQLLHFDITASDPDGDSIALSSDMPTGATLNDLGNGRATFSWTPTIAQSGIYTITVQATSLGLTTATSFLVTVNDLNQAPSITAPASHTVDEGGILAFAVAGSDPDGDAVTLKGMNLPSGATFTDLGNGTGSFRWSPDTTQAGEYTAIRFEASDGKLTATADARITVHDRSSAAPASGAPVFNTLDDIIVDEGTLLAFSVAAQDPEGNRATLTAERLPSGATFTDLGDSTGVFRWLPDYGQGGVYTGITFRAHDGTQTSEIFLTVTVEEVNTGGAFIDSRNFYAFAAKQRNGASLAVGNVVDDLRDEIITGAGAGSTPLVRIYANDGSLRKEFQPYPSRMKKGVTVAACDLNGDDIDEILVLPGPGVAQRIRAYSGQGKALAQYGFRILGGKETRQATFACGDVDGDHRDDIVVALAHGGSPYVTIYGPTGTVRKRFTPYTLSYRQGLRVGLGDLDGDGRKEVLIASTYNPQVQVFRPNGTRRASWTPFGRTYRRGIAVAAADTDGDGKQEVLAVSGSGADARVKIFTDFGRKQTNQFRAYPRSQHGGAAIAGGDVDGDGAEDIITVPSGAASAWVKLFDRFGKPL